MTNELKNIFGMVRVLMTESPDANMKCRYCGSFMHSVIKTVLCNSCFDAMSNACRENNWWPVVTSMHWTRKTTVEEFEKEIMIHKLRH